MKGIVFTEFMEMVEHRYSADMVDDIIDDAKPESGGVYTAVATYPHEEMVALISSLSERTGISVQDELKAFGVHLFGRFYQLYPEFFEGVPDAFSFLSSIEGNQVLQQVASRLRDCLGEADTLCRLAGDEFLIVRTAVKDQATLGELGDSLLKVLGHPISLETGPMDANVSIGIAIYPDDGIDAENLMRNADTALYAAKAGGRRQYQFFNAQMNADLVHNLEVRDSLRLAIAHKQFILHYQPKIDLDTREVTGVEALLRWQHPSRGLTYPDYFITIAEESELIVEIGDWVIEQACQQAAEWQSQGLGFGGIAINISALQFKRRDLVSLVKHHLHQSGLAPSKLELELTESILIEDFPKAMDAIRILRELGRSSVSNGN